MARTIRGIFIGGLIKPLEKLDFKEGDEIAITIDDSFANVKPGEGLKNSAGGWKGLIDGEQLIKDIYESRLVSTRPGVNL